ncbi:MAG: ABC transporter permease [Chloroflexi bacterium]|nr:ABC transporter permease [Chloroflexota bacterium]
MTSITAFGYETYYLGLWTIRRFLRVPSNFISIIFFPLIQLLVFSQLYKDIVQLPGFGGQTNYLAYMVPGQVVFTAFMAVAWSAYGLLIEYRTGYLDKLWASPISRWSVLAGEMAPLFLQAAIMAGILLIVSLLLGAAIVTGVGGFLLILALAGVFGIAFAGTSFIPALLTKSEQATTTFSLLLFPLMFMSTAFVLTARLEWTTMKRWFRLCPPSQMGVDEWEHGQHYDGQSSAISLVLSYFLREMGCKWLA